MFQTRMLKTAMAVAIVFAPLLWASQAHATDCALSSPYTGLFLVNSGGTSLSGIGADSGLQDCTNVTQQDKLWSNFNLGGLPNGKSTVTFDFSTVNGEDVHTIGFGAPFGSSGKNFTWSYMVNVIGNSGITFKDAATDALGARGTATVMTSLMDNLGNTYTITLNFVNGLCQNGCPNLVNLAPGATSLMVTDTLTLGAGGSNMVGLSNSFTQMTSPVPEPGTLAMFGSGLVGVAALLRRKKQSV